MVTEQETLIYIEDKDKLDASAAANAFAHKDVKNRAYINTLGAELALKYLASEDIDISNIHNIHSIKKILEEIDVSDIMLPGIHIDVRVVFDEKAIFIPKSHFEYNLVPDIYLVFDLAKDFSHVKFLGFFEPKLINKNNANDKYYFIEKEKLSSAKDLKKYIEAHNNSTSEKLSEDILSNSERIIISMADNDISEDDKKYLIKQLTKSAELRDKFIEYENFETLSYKAMTDPQIKKKEISSAAVENLEPIEDLESLALDEAAGTSPDKTSKDNSHLTDIAASAIAGAAAGTIAGAAAGAAAIAAGEVVNSVNTAAEISGLAEAGLNIASSGLEIAKDLTSSSNMEEKTISFDDIDITQLDSSVVTEEKVEAESISLENVELPETNKTDFIDTIDNKITLDNVMEAVETPDELNIIEDEKISLEDVKLPKADEIADEDSTQETVSFDNINTDNIQNQALNIDENMPDNTISFDNIMDTAVPAQKTETPKDTAASFDTAEENENSDTIIETDDFMNDVISLDEEISEPVLDDAPLAEPLEAENSSEENSTENEGFGKNLLENLSSENLDNISIEDLGIEDENQTNTNADDISSNELLSQIDDILSTSTTSEKPIEPDELTNFLEPEISETEQLDDIPVEETVNNDENIENTSTADINDFLNANQNGEETSPDDIGVLFNDTDPVTDAELDNLDDLPESVPGAALMKKNKSNKSRILVAAALVTVIAAASAFMIFKPKQDSDIVEPIAAENTADNTSENETTENILATNAPDIKKDTVQNVQKPQAPKELKNTPVKHGSPESYLDVSKLVWDVPDSLSYSPKMQNYLRTAGKSIKLSLSADLLLANEYAYTNQVKVGLKLSKDGSIQDTKIISGSGSTQIDDIVLQSVKDTLNVVKPPSNEIKTPDFNLSLIIYF